MKSFLPIILALLSPALATVDWSTPCHAGQCAWQIPATESSSSGIMHIWGSVPAIADITPAAGWSILGCSANAASQDIRIACTDPDAECGHLLQTDAVGKIVRLPDGCGASPFAQITALSVSEDQLVPKHLLRRSVSSPKVYSVSLSNSFSDRSQHGPVNFAVHLTSSPKIDTTTITPPSTVRHPVRSIAEHREHQMKQQFVRDSAHNFFTRDLEFDGNKFEISDDAQIFPPISINHTGNLFNVSVDNCVIDGVPFDAAVSADATATATASISLGISATGQLLPLPKIDSAAITASFTGSVDGSLHIKASADGTFTSPSITLVDVPLPGDIGIPGVLDIGPTFLIVASASLDLAAGIETVIGLSYAVDNATLVFPPDAGPSSGKLTPNDTPLALSTDTNATGDASVTAHIIPQLSVGISAFGNEVGANVSLYFDASTTLSLNGTTGVQTQTSSDAVILPPTGCVEIDAAVNVGASVGASLLDLFKVGDSVSFFNKSFDLFSTCGTADSSGLTKTTSVSSAYSSSTSISSSSGAAYSTSSSSTKAATSASASYSSSATAPSSSAYSGNSTSTPSASYARKRTPAGTLAKRAEFSCPSLPFDISPLAGKVAVVTPTEVAQ